VKTIGIVKSGVGKLSQEMSSSGETSVHTQSDSRRIRAVVASLFYGREGASKKRECIWVRGKKRNLRIYPLGRRGKEKCGKENVLPRIKSPATS